MDKITKFSGTGLPLERSDVDTDQIIPSDWLKRVERTGFGAGLFGEWRADKTFILNDPSFNGASILIAGPNFGTGSSREHAVWALTDYGFKAVVSSKFGDIFYNNSTKAGLVPVIAAPEIVTQLQDAVKRNPDTEITIDIQTLTLSCSALGISVNFPLDAFTQYRFLQGLDDIGITLARESEITKFEQTRKSWLPQLA